MVFYLIGLGLGDAKDITVKGLEIVKSASRVYLEAYTSILTIGKEALVSWSPLIYYWLGYEWSTDVTRKIAGR